SQCNVRPCETRYSTTDPSAGECGQILETLKGQPPSNCKLQILTLGRIYSIRVATRKAVRRWRRCEANAAQNTRRIFRRIDRGELSISGSRPIIAAPNPVLNFIYERICRSG
ncbi:hypothetical protein M9978_10420, partial [Sphingomonas sp. MG17]